MLPKIDLTTFFLSISQAAMQALQAPANGKADLEMAKHNIDLLELLQEKTTGNLTPDETQLLTHLLFQLRMTFVKASAQSAAQSSSSQTSQTGTSTEKKS